MNHEQVQHILSSKQSVDTATQAQLDQHLATCGECQQFAQMSAALQADRWNPYRKALLSPEQKHDLLAQLTPQVRRNDMKKKSPHTNWATALAAVAVIVVISVYVFTTSQRISELQATVTTLPNEVNELQPTLSGAAEVTRLIPTVPPPSVTATPIGTTDNPVEIEVTRIPPTVPFPTSTPIPVDEESDQSQTGTLPVTATAVSDPLGGSDIRRQAQISSGQWMAFLEDRIFQEDNYAKHTVTLREINGGREYTVYDARENIGLGGLWVDLLHFSADNQHFYFTPGIAWHGCRLFGGGGSVVQVDLTDGSSTNFENLTGFAHTFNDNNLVAFVIGHDVSVYNFATGESLRFELPIATENTEVGGIVWQTITVEPHVFDPNRPIYLAATVAHNPCGQEWTQGLYIIDIVNNTVEQLLAPTETLQNFRPIAWQDGNITLENPMTDEQRILNVGTGELTP